MLPAASAEQSDGREARHLAEKIPTRHIERRFRVPVSTKRPIHAIVDNAQLRRIQTDQFRGNLCNSGPGPFGEGWQICRSQRTDLAVSDHARVRFDGDNRRIKNFDKVPARPTVAAFRQWQVHLKYFDSSDASIQEQLSYAEF